MKKASLWGKCESIMAASSLPKSVLRKLIPNQIDFSPQNFTGPDEHPIIYMFNTQKIHIFLSFFRLSYYEMIPLIPHVHFKNNPEVNYQMSPILYVSSFWIVLGGQLLWHLNKVLGKFNVPTPISEFPKVKYYSQKVFRKKIEAIEIEAKANGNEGTIQDFPNAEKLSELWHTDAIINNDTTFWTAKYVVTDHEVQGANTVVNIKDIEGLPSEVLEIPSITQQVMGAFKLNFDWKLWWPKKYNATYVEKKLEIIEDD